MFFSAVSYIFSFRTKLLTGIFLLSVLSPSTGFAQSVCHDISMETISRHLAMPGTAKILEKHDRGSICEVILRTSDSLAPVYVNQDFVLIGQLFQDRQPVTRHTLEALKETAKKEREQMARQKAVQAKHRKHFLSARISELEECVSITLAPKEPSGKPSGKPSEPVYIITDPGCSHCKSALKYLAKLSLEYGIAVKMIIYPILGDESKKMAVNAICRDFSYEDYLAMKAPVPKLSSPCRKSRDSIEKTIAFLKKADIDSVPVIIGSKASWIVEGNKMAQVREHLHLDTPDITDSEKKP